MMLRQLINAWIILAPILFLWILWGNKQDRNYESKKRTHQRNARTDWIRLKVKRANKHRSWIDA
jgi:hypothetical protein